MLNYIIASYWTLFFSIHQAWQWVCFKNKNQQIFGFLHSSPRDYTSKKMRAMSGKFVTLYEEYTDFLIQRNCWANTEQFSKFFCVKSQKLSWFESSQNFFCNDCIFPTCPSFSFMNVVSIFILFKKSLFYPNFTLTYDKSNLGYSGRRDDHFKEQAGL